MISTTITNSSNIFSVGYEDENLYVSMKGGDYVYKGVPRSMYDGIIGAESAGKYLNEHIKPHYPCEKMKGVPEADKDRLAVDLIITDSRIDMPQYGTPGSAAIDLRACIDEPLTLQPDEVKLVGTGLRIHIKNAGYAGMILPRSGTGHKQGIVLGNLVGLVDSDYQGELKMSVWNRSLQPVTINPLDRIAQYVVVKVSQLDMNVVTEFEASERGSGGFGSTGVSDA
jgi:dUTP pyrophosphatase